MPSITLTIIMPPNHDYEGEKFTTNVSSFDELSEIVDKCNSRANLYQSGDRYCSSRIIFNNNPLTDFNILRNGDILKIQFLPYTKKDRDDRLKSFKESFNIIDIKKDEDRKFSV